MQDDLIAAYNKVAPLCWTQKEAYNRTIKQPAPRYYISARQATQILSKMVRGDFFFVKSMHKNKQRLYFSLFDKVMEMSEKSAFIGKPLYYIVQFAILQPAPEFFISDKQMQFIRLNLKNGRIADDGRTDNRIWANVYQRAKEKRRILREYRQERKRERELRNQLQSAEPSASHA